MQSREHRRLIRLAGAMNQKAARLGARGRVTAADLAMLQLRVRQCEYCGTDLEIGQGSFEHRLPYDRGGQNLPSNLTRCCLTCNRRKFVKTPEEYAQYKQLMVKCVVCSREYKPRWAEWQRGRARTCSHKCAGSLRWGA
jgi:5-methylcytosine-specific restriction endonuclease McrA